MLTTFQIDRWKQIKQEANADVAWLSRCKEVDAKRLKVRTEIVELLKKYVAGGISTEDLRGTFDRRTRTEWTGFGFKGMSGAMFVFQE